MDLSIDWSRAQFGLTAIYHFLFVPLTLGLSFIVAIMESIYVKTGKQEWRDITKFWLTLFGINFAIGVATGIIMEFEFGTNWANYSWFVGDIFGAPLAIEGIVAFFLEATFFAVMFFGWDRVSKRFHLVSTWLVAIGSNLSAFWILVANGWMQYPVGTIFNPDTARNEMASFMDVALSPVAVSKFLHTVASGYVISALFVMGVSAWYLLKGKYLIAAKKSLVIGASFGFITSMFLFFSGDESAYQVTQKQPMKLAAMEGIYDGEHRASLVAFGILNPDKKPGDSQSTFLFDVSIPYALSILGKRDTQGFVPGINDLLYGNEEKGIVPMDTRIQNGKRAVEALKTYKLAKESGGSITLTEDPMVAAKDADVLYTDVWVSMGENDWSERIKLLKPYTVTMKMMQMTGTPDDQLIFMHCLPAFHDRTTQVGEEIYEKYGLNEMEVTDEVFNSKYAW